MTLPSLRTARLTLEPWARHEVDAVHQLLTDPGVRRYLLDDMVISRERAAEFVERHLAVAASLRTGTWGLRLEPGGMMIGFCGITVVEGSEAIELMYGLLPEHWGSGLATEAARAVLQHLWQATLVERVFARADPPNVKSLAVMRQLGMQPHDATPGLISYVLDRPQRQSGMRVLTERR